MPNATRDLPQQIADFGRGHRAHTSELHSVELFDLIKLAELGGYSVKSAHSSEARNHAILTDIYAVWFAIKNQIPIFEHNIPVLVEFIAWKFSSGRPAIQLMPRDRVH